MWWRVLALVAAGFILGTGCHHHRVVTGGATGLREDGSVESAGRDRGYTGKAIPGGF